jgi:hypothetical protein
VFIKHGDARVGFVTIKPGQKKTGNSFLEMLARHLSSRKGPGESASLVEKMKGLNVFSVAYIHYTEAQVKLLCSKAKGGQNLNASSVIDYQLAKETCHGQNPDPHDRLSDGTLYISPNVPEAEVRIEVTRMESPRNERTTSRIERRAVSTEEAKTKEDVCRERDNAKIDKERATAAISEKDNIIQDPSGKETH